MIIIIIIIIIIIEKSFHANFRSYGSRARFELRESRAAGLFREETRRSVRRREERQRGGEGEGGNSISARTSANSHSVVIVYDDDECANNDALVSLPARSWEQFAPAIRPAFRPFEKQGTNFFLPSPFVWEKKKKGKGGEREGRKEGRKARPIFPTTTVVRSIFPCGVDVCPFRRRLTVPGRLSISLGNEHRGNEGWEEGR